MSLAHTVKFFQQYVKAPYVVGAIAPSSRHLAAALVQPFAEASGPANVLEIGAGTGAVTRAIGDLLGPQDNLDVCEIQPALADILDQQVLNAGKLAIARREGRVQLIRGSVENLDAQNKYDFIISGLPLTAFDLETVQRILAVIAESLKPGGVFSYFEYVGLRKMACKLVRGSRGRAFRAVSQHMDQQIAKYQVGAKRVWKNAPPATGRYWTFEPLTAATQSD